MNILKNNYKIEYEELAIAYTEAPDNLKAILKQRIRWVFGTFQVSWKNRNILFRLKYGLLGIVGIINILFSQLLFSIFAPIVDILATWLIISSLFQYFQYPDIYSINTIYYYLFYYYIFIMIDIFISVFAFVMEKKENPNLLYWFPLQRFIYRKLIYVITFRVLKNIFKGGTVSWENTVRKNTVRTMAQLV
jgi:cellulose synthase/poly-beta-1,6-N-acetylglucosamine synthase-like glycosyltransferase